MLETIDLKTGHNFMFIATKMLYKKGLFNLCFNLGIFTMCYMLPSKWFSHTLSLYNQGGIRLLSLKASVDKVVAEK